MRGFFICKFRIYFIILLNFCSMDWSLSINGTQLATLGATTAPQRRVWFRFGAKTLSF
jgi:hypothetical protein